MSSNITNIDINETGNTVPTKPADRTLFQVGDGGAENAGVENAGVENAGVDRRGGKCRSDNVWKAEI